MENPFISIIIPCYNSASTIAACLRSLEAQDYPGFEIIAVDDCSRDGTSGILESFSRVKVFKNTANKGPGFSRNLAIKNSRGDLIVFLDSDCLVQDNQWLRKHAAVHKLYSRVIVGGAIDGFGYSYVAKADRYSHWLGNIPHAKLKYPDQQYLVTAHMSIRRADLDSIGELMEKYWSGEDVDFSERARRAGIKLRLETDIVVKHKDRETLKSFLSTFYRSGIDRVPVRRWNRYRYWWLLPAGPISSVFLFAPLSFLLSIQAVSAWWRYEKKVVLYYPLILLGRGIAVYLGIIAFFLFYNKPSSRT